MGILSQEAFHFQQSPTPMALNTNNSCKPTNGSTVILFGNHSAKFLIDRRCFETFRSLFAQWVLVMTVGKNVGYFIGILWKHMDCWNFLHAALLRKKANPRTKAPLIPSKFVSCCRAIFAAACWMMKKLPRTKSCEMKVSHPKKYTSHSIFEEGILLFDEIFWKVQIFCLFKNVLIQKILF